MAKADLTAERLRELLNYNPDTGVFTWRVNRGSNKTAGNQAGHRTSGGYFCISIDGNEYHSHALAWLYVYGVLPKIREIVRLNSDLADNRIANLAEHIKSKDREVTQDRLKSELDYCEETGHFRWRISPVNTIKAGSDAGVLDADGYIRIKIGSASYAAHRLAWLYVHGVWPAHEIDHINGVRNDNRIANLRDIPRTGNIQNQRTAQAGSKSGLLGVYSNHGKWRAVIQVNKKTIALGNFSTPEEAHAAYVEAKRRLHPTCTI
jgi:hypothetical protein